MEENNLQNEGFVYRFVDQLFKPGLSSEHLLVFNVSFVLLFIFIMATIFMGSSVNIHLIVFLVLALGLFLSIQYFLLQASSTAPEKEKEN